jgi:hypothetical protein
MSDGDAPPRPEDVSDRAALKRALHALARGRSLSKLEKASIDLARERRVPEEEVEEARLSTTTLSDLFNPKKGGPTERTIDRFLDVLLHLDVLTDREWNRWKAAWTRTQMENIDVTTETEAIEAAPDYAGMIDAWLARQEQNCLAESSPPESSFSAIRQFAEDSFAMIAETGRLAQQLPTQPLGRADPVAFGRFGAAAFDLFLQRVTQLPEAIRRTPSRAGNEADYRDQVTKYLQDCRRALDLRARIMVAQWPGCALRLRLTNPGEADLLGLVVRLSFPSDVHLIEPVLCCTPPPGLPPRPIRSGTTGSPAFTLRDVYKDDLGLVRRLTEVIQEKPRSHEYEVIEADVSTVEISGIDLPSKGSITLPHIPLLLTRAEGNDLTVRWTATGRAPHERYDGSLSLPVTASTLPLDGLLPST